MDNQIKKAVATLAAAAGDGPIDVAAVRAALPVSSRGNEKAFIAVTRGLAAAGVTVIDEKDAEEIERLVASFPAPSTKDEKEVPQARDSYEAILRIASRHPPLTKEELLAVVARVKAGIELDKEKDKKRNSPQKRGEGRAPVRFRLTTNGAKLAADTLVRHNLRFVLLVVNRTVPAHLRRSPSFDFAMAMAEGSLGLIRACQSFDPTLGYAFHTYASWWIRQAVSRALEGMGHIRIPFHQHARLREVDRLLREGVGFDEAIVSLASTLQGQENLRAAWNVRHGPASLDQPLRWGRGDGADLTLGELIAGSSDGDHAVESNDECGTYLVLFYLLTHRQRVVLAYRLGGDVLEDIGDRYALTRERIRQIESQALQRIERLHRILGTRSCVPEETTVSAPLLERRRRPSLKGMSPVDAATAYRVILSETKGVRTSAEERIRKEAKAVAKRIASELGIGSDDIVRRKPVPERSRAVPRETVELAFAPVADRLRPDARGTPADDDLVAWRQACLHRNEDALVYETLVASRGPAAAEQMLGALLCAGAVRKTDIPGRWEEVPGPRVTMELLRAGLLAKLEAIRRERNVANSVKALLERRGGSTTDIEQLEKEIAWLERQHEDGERLRHRVETGEEVRTADLIPFTRPLPKRFV